MKAILSAPGSRGDVNPMIAIGKRLVDQGWQVVISLAQPYVDLAQQAGLEAEPLISRDRFDRLLALPHLWKPIRGARTMLGTVASEFLPLHLEVIQKHFTDGHTVLVSHPLDLASRIFRETQPTAPLVDIHLAPSMLRTYHDPAKMTPWSWEFSRPEWLVRFAYRIVDRLLVDPVIVSELNDTRRKLGLQTPVRRVIDQWWLSPDRILAMYPSWFAPATTIFQPRLVHCGFPLDDLSCDELDDDMFHSDSQQRPIVFTAGTVHRSSQSFFSHCVDACLQLSHPGWLVSTDPNNFPQSLPRLVRCLSYVSFAKLFPHAGVVVHHGGVGTTSQCLAVGVPQLIRPMAFDQFDNARHIERLGVGKRLYRIERLTESLRGLLRDDQLGASCQRLADKLSGSGSGVDRAADEIMSVASSTDQ